MSAKMTGVHQGFQRSHCRPFKFIKGCIIAVVEDVFLEIFPVAFDQLGLDGKAFINLLLGYGCNIPAVMGTRILSSRYNRIVTMLLIPFTLCSARLQVFVFLTAILFPSVIAPWVLFALYVGSFIAIFAMGLLLKSLRIAGKPEPFIMEIPPYRIPSVRGVILRTWQELKDFLYRAATLIVAGVMVVWLLTHFPADVPPASAETWAGQLGQFFSPVFLPLGIQWQETIDLQPSDMLV